MIHSQHAHTLKPLLGVRAILPVFFTRHTSCESDTVVIRVHAIQAITGAHQAGLHAGRVPRHRGSSSRFACARASKLVAQGRQGTRRVV